MDKIWMINMNGRLYDPVSGQILSPDNNVSSTFSQGSGFKIAVDKITKNLIKKRYDYLKNTVNEKYHYTDMEGNIGELILCPGDGKYYKILNFNHTHKNEIGPGDGDIDFNKYIKHDCYIWTFSLNRWVIYKNGTRETPEILIKAQ
ncbi:hypothetical protein KAZ01_02780 [Candidatus Gracilibacteria bacterium]|nr:hypothetical protein [Candidatus Gracilibacteria bacterium]